VGLQLDLTGKSSDHGPWSQQMLATEEGRKLIAEASQKMLKLITMIPKVLEVPAPPTPEIVQHEQLKLLNLQPEARRCAGLDQLIGSLRVLGLQILPPPTPPYPSTALWSDLFIALADQLLNAVILVDMSVPGLPIKHCNQAFADLTGWTREETIGRNCRFLQGSQTEAASLAALIDAVRNGTPLLIPITNVRKDGKIFLNSLSLHPIRDSNGVYRYNVGVLVDFASLSIPGPMSTELRALRAKMPSNFNAALEPAPLQPYSQVHPLVQWRMFTTNCAKMIRLLWATDPDGALSKLMTMPMVLRQPAIASLGRYLASSAVKAKLPQDEMLLQRVVSIHGLIAASGSDNPNKLTEIPYELVNSLCEQLFGAPAYKIAMKMQGS
jgi:PAS domain S-box-containing protein